MSRRAWAYIWGVFLAWAVLSGAALSRFAPTPAQWLAFAALVSLATLAQLFKAEAPSHTWYYATPIFFFAGLLLLDRFLFVLLILIPHLIEWAKERLVRSSYLSAWYLQPFNIAMYSIAGFGAYPVYAALNTTGASVRTPSWAFAATAAALVYVTLNHVLLGLALVLARGKSWRESGALDAENLLIELILLCLGVVVAALWVLSPWLIPLALSPLVLIYQALMIPLLKKEAQTDAKTGLWNAGHFTTLFTAELERARRFSRPLAFIMADLDLLREINNTYGHLAGDTVLAGIGQIIRKTIREYDIAGRFGGEEFAIVLPEAGLPEAQALAERVRRAIEAAHFEVATSPTPIRATMSLGIACFPADATTPTALSHAADVAVYQAKLKGRNCVVCASDIPHSIKLEGTSAEALQAAPYPIAFASGIEPAATGVQANAPAAAVPPESTTPNGIADASMTIEPNPPAAAAPTPHRTSILLPLFVGLIVLAGTAMTGLGFVLRPQLTLPALVLFTALAVLAEFLQVELYGDGSTSVSVAIAFAAALVAGIPGVVFASAAIALTHYVQHHKKVHFYQTAFNWATHVLAGSAPAILIGALAIPVQVSNLLVLMIPSALAALCQYAIETGLIASAMALAEGTNPAVTWREQFRWLAGHYLALGIIGLFLSIAYTALGPLGVLVFILPLFMMHYAQKQYIAGTRRSVSELQRLNRELTRANQEILSASRAIRQLNDELFLTLSKIIDARDPYVGGHAAKVADYATAIAVELGLPLERVEQVRQAALLHDIGKIGISEQLLHKPDKLTAEEYEHIKRHATLGAELLATAQGLRHLAPFVRHHHERWDGRGYPSQLAGERIPLEARILAVCDAVEAMASDRPYQQGRSQDEIIVELRRCAGTQFDPHIVETFIRILERADGRLIVNSAQEVIRRRTELGGWSMVSSAPFRSPGNDGCLAG